MPGERIGRLIAGPGCDGNSGRLAESLTKHRFDTLCIHDHSGGTLRDCRTCRDTQGDCFVGDRYGELLVGHILRSAAIVIAWPRLGSAWSTGEPK